MEKGRPEGDSDMAKAERSLEAIEAVRHGFQLGSHVSVTELSRSSQWREDLNKYLAMQVMDRSKTVAVLLKPEVFQAMVGYLQELERELDQVEAEKVVLSREQRQKWVSGKELEDGAKQYLRGLRNGHS